MLKFTPEMSLVIIIMFSSLLGAIAIFMDNYFSEYVSFYAFIIFAGIYYFLFHYFLRGKKVEILDV